MTDQDFKEMALWITKHLAGKTLAGATFQEHGMGYSIVLLFEDGTKAEISPEYDEGFRFKLLP